MPPGVADLQKRRGTTGKFMLDKTERSRIRSIGHDSASIDLVAGPAVPLYQQAYDLLSIQIRTGAVPPGTRITEASIASDLGISRTPARRALKMLYAEGLVRDTNEGGYVVRKDRRRSAQKDSTSLVPAEAKISFSSSWERIYQHVEAEIAARIVFGSWRLNEAKLAEAYGVSRTVARDVVGRLQQRGILAKDSSSRWYAPALSADLVNELYELRQILEPYALVGAAPNLPTTFLSDMRRRMESLMTNKKIHGQALDEIESDLHITLLSFSENNSLLDALSKPQALLITHSYLYRWSIGLVDVEPLVPEHLAIVRALERGRVQQAGELLEHHLHVSRARTLVRMEAVVRNMHPPDVDYLQKLP